MVADGYQDVHNVDYSPVAIELLKEMHRQVPG